ncbi:serine/threonine-protein kinase [Tahibacter amnicola]|uniref:Serine/threonine protein kinase n=1 Tax=Tahibacter amnicola TaxID=2976241 RepID=A0ABY6BFW0_9GAMM|nr:serine/threonine-protein kinase [Tahibacter amnicola]UXI68715.1 serine/threonine protein kinase [Tahibacter amnicola]
MKTHLGHYDIVAELGRGGMGVVYKGYEPSLNRYVAIKVLAESLAHDESVKERFLREARSMASLNDPHIIQIYFIGEHEGQTFFVMEFVEGESLGSLLKREGRLRTEQAARVIYQTALGLATAHEKGVVHRDIKPGNLMVTSRGAIKIADFGIALVTQDFSKKLTSTGEFVGTPGYLSPEVCLGKTVDQRSDIFSLGIVLFEMLTGRMPFTDESPLGLMLEVVRADIPDVRQLNSDVDAELSRVLTRMIAKDPADRYQDCHELVADLGRHAAISGNPTINLRPVISTAAATVIGMKTPTSGQRPLPPTQPTPRPGPVAHAPTMASAMPTPPPAPRPSVMERQGAPTRRSSPLPWAIAAAVLLALGGGAYAFRNQIPFLKGAPTVAETPAAVTAPVATAATQPPPATTPPATPAITAPATTAPASTTSPPAVAATDALPASTTPPAATTGTLLVAATDNAPAKDAAPSASADQRPAETASPASADARPSEVQVADTRTTGGETGPEPRASRVEALRELAAARAGQNAGGPGPRMARIPPQDSQTGPVEPKVPTIAVIVGGDPVIAGPARQEVTRALQRSGFNVIEGGRAREDNDLDAGRLAGRANAAVVVYVRPVGSQVLTYYGQASTLYTAQISLRAFAIKGKRPLGAGWTEQVNFTSLNAAEKAREVIEPMADDMAQALDEFRARRRG